MPAAFLLLLSSFYGRASLLLPNLPIYHHYTIEDGLPSDAVYGAMQDREGYIWIYTEKGIAKFDGYEFKNYGVNDGLPSFDIWGLTEDSQDRIWIHTKSDKLCYIFQDSIHQIKTPKGRTYFVSKFNEHDGKVWFTQGSGNRMVESTIVGDTLFERDLSTAQMKLLDLKKEGAINYFYLDDSHRFVNFNKDSVFYFNEQGRIEMSKAIISGEWNDTTEKDDFFFSYFSLGYRPEQGLIDKSYYFYIRIWDLDL